MKTTRPPDDRFLDISNAHVSKDTADWLDREGLVAASVRTDTDPFPRVTLGRMPYGWFVVVPSTAREGVPADLESIFGFARARGFGYVMLDRDADAIDDLPTHEW